MRRETKQGTPHSVLEPSVHIATWKRVAHVEITTNVFFTLLFSLCYTYHFGSERRQLGGIDRLRILWFQMGLTHHLDFFDPILWFGRHDDLVVGLDWID